MTVKAGLGEEAVAMRGGVRDDKKTQGWGQDECLEWLVKAMPE